MSIITGPVSVWTDAWLTRCDVTLPVDEVIVLPAIAHLQHKLLPQVGHSSHAAVVEVYQTHAQRQPVGQTVPRSRLQHAEQVLPKRNTRTHAGVEN